MKKSTILSGSLLMVAMFLVPSLTAQIDFWQKANGPYGGPARSIAITERGHIFVGTVEGGIFRSTDHCATWTQANSGLNHLYVSAVVSQANGNLLAGTWEDGMYRSTNSGESWTGINDGLTALSIRAVATTRRGEIFVGTSRGGIFRSLDNGDTWTNVVDALNVQSLMVTPGDRIFAGTEGNGVYFSADGQTWAQANDGLTTLNIQSLAAGVWPATDAPRETIYAGSEQGGIFRGVVWNGPPVWEQRGLRGMTIQGVCVNSFNQIFAATADEGVFTSYDQGLTWSPFNPGLSDSDIRSICSNSDGELLAASEAGVVYWRAAEEGAPWCPAMTGLQDVHTRTILVTTTDEVYVGTVNRGIFRSPDRGARWVQINDGLEHLDISSLFAAPLPVIDGPPARGRHLYAGTTGGPVYRSTNNGESWSPVGSGLTGLSVVSFTVNSEGFLFAAAMGGNAGVYRPFMQADNVTEPPGAVYRSIDNGNSWEWKSRGITMPPSALAANSVREIFAGTRGDGVFKSIDDGEQWYRSAEGLSSQFINVLLVDSEDRVFAGTEGGGVCLSTDGGNRWVPVNRGLGDNFVSDLRFTRDGFIIAATYSHGLFVSLNGGQTWLPFHRGSFPDVAVTALGFASDGQLFAATYGEGVLRSAHYPDAPAANDPREVPTSIKLDQNYPNPFNPQTIISYQLTAVSQVSLAVYDLLGREVATLVDGIEEPGYKMVTFDASGLSSGVYFYRLDTGGFVLVRKLQLLK